MLVVTASCAVLIACLTIAATLAVFCVCKCVLLLSNSINECVNHVNLASRYCAKNLGLLMHFFHRSQHTMLNQVEGIPDTSFVSRAHQVSENDQCRRCLHS